LFVRPTQGFGGPRAIGVTVGTAEENAFLADALGRVAATAARAS
jgi:histidinol-phosphate/aromatic aminotransferase/cobyric acid decarboxylase-like protein